MLVYLDENDVEVLKKFDRTNYYGFEEWTVLKKIIEQIQEHEDSMKGLNKIAKLTCEEDS